MCDPEIDFINCSEFLTYDVDFPVSGIASAGFIPCDLTADYTSHGILILGRPYIRSAVMFSILSIRIQLENVLVLI